MAGVHMFNFTEVKVTDLKAQIELGVETDSKGNDSYWQVHGVPQFDFKNIHIGTDNMVFNAAIDVFHQVLVMYLKADEKGFKSAFKKGLDLFNAALKVHTPLLLPLPHNNHHFFNATDMHAPILDSETQIAEVAVDGTIFDTYLKTSHVEPTNTKA